MNRRLMPIGSLPHFLEGKSQTLDVTALQNVLTFVTTRCKFI